MSTKKSASEDKLGEGHDEFAELCLEILRARDPATGARIRPSAAEMSVIRAFFKDNDITCAPGEGNAIDALKRELARQRQERQQPKASTAGLPFDPTRDLPDGASPLQ